MRKIYVIGTVHNMLPGKKKELKSLLEDIDPDQILVEIVNKDLRNNRIRKYPKEMIFAYIWAIKNGKKVNGSDVPINIIRKGFSQKELKIVEKSLTKIASKYTWKELNKSKYIRKLEIFDDKIIDKKKHRLRQKKMLENIQKNMIKDGTILILTGSGHLKFFEKKLKEAIFPFRH